MDCGRANALRGFFSAATTGVRSAVAKADTTISVARLMAGMRRICVRLTITRSAASSRPSVPREVFVRLQRVVIQLYGAMDRRTEPRVEPGFGALPAARSGSKVCRSRRLLWQARECSDAPLLQKSEFLAANERDCIDLSVEDTEKRLPLLIR